MLFKTVFVAGLLLAGRQGVLADCSAAAASVSVLTEYITFKSVEVVTVTATQPAAEVVTHYPHHPKGPGASRPPPVYSNTSSIPANSPVVAIPQGSPNSTWTVVVSSTTSTSSSFVRGPKTLSVVPIVQAASTSSSSPASSLMSTPTATETFFGLGTRYGDSDGCTEEDCWQNGACSFVDIPFLLVSMDQHVCLKTSGTTEPTAEVVFL